MIKNAPNKGKGTLVSVLPLRLRILRGNGTKWRWHGNWLNGFEGAHGATFPARSAICFEAQCFPDTPNKPHFPSATLLPGDEYQQITVYKFAVEE